MTENKQGLITTANNTNGFHNLNNGATALVPTNGNHATSAPKTKPATAVNEVSRAALERAENDVAKKYDGWRGYWRLFIVSSVIGKLALYLYLDRYEISYDYGRRNALKRLEAARSLNTLAVLGEYILEIYRWFVDRFLRMLRWWIFRGEANKEARQLKQAEWLKRSILSLGPTFIKIGQALGTRADLLPISYVKELGSLQDDVPSFPNDIAFARIEKELGKPISELYAEFDVEPIAAASLGQVYRAKLVTGEEVAVKVQRPNLAGTIRGDVAIMAQIAKFAERFPSLNENADWGGMLKEFDETIHEEMDYSAEGRNAERFSENFKDWDEIHVP
ncbi:MAG: AarF/ABC1/UbiB kinase family protein, partial [Pyrinomonadaceae bacterium]|nr:AarF/ABC1/UbiB kinase family protein [Pyrinomonadaceae bacterium]